MWFSLFIAVIASLNAGAESAPQAAPGWGLRRVTSQGPIGGPGGEIFGDSPENNTGIHAISISYQSKIESIQLTYRMSDGSLYKGARHGGHRYPQYTITLADDEYVERVEGTTDSVYVSQMTITTFQPSQQERRTYGPFGWPAKQTYSLEGYIVTLYGRCGDYVNNLGAIIIAPLDKSIVFGGENGYDFDEKPDTFFSSPVMKITKILINYSDKVYAIQFEYLLLDGRVKSGAVHGKPFGNWSTITIGYTETLLGIRGLTDTQYIGQLTFIVQTPSVEKGFNVFKYYGPFGKSDFTRPFAAYGDSGIIGFRGNEGFGLNGIAIYYY